MIHSPAPESLVTPRLSHYLKGFTHPDRSWPAEPLPDDPALAWWRSLFTEELPEALPGVLARALPQLRLPQREGISASQLYRQVVLRGESPEPGAMVDAASVFRCPAALRGWLADHPCGSLPVLATSDATDFLWMVRALAHRGEPVDLEPGVHAQALSGLIHWGLIEQFGPSSRARLILLHDAPYGSVSASDLPVDLDEEAWIQASCILRLEHELTHLAIRQVLGEMRRNLLDELIADVMGQLKALGRFSAAVFGLCLQDRWRTYVGDLNDDEARCALTLTLRRAQELDDRLRALPRSVLESRGILPWLCRQRLDRPILAPDAPDLDPAAPSAVRH